MLSRFYCLFAGILLVILAIGGYSSRTFMGGSNLSWWIPTIWLVVGVISLIVGFTLRNVNSLRMFAGVLGILLLAWGIIGLTANLNLRDILSTVLAAIGAFGIASALAPAQWIREREVYAHG